MAGSRQHELKESQMNAEEVVKERVEYRSTNGRSLIKGYCWHTPSRTPWGVLLLVHGMVEHIDRYDTVAKTLARCGLIVMGSDLIAHGSSVASKEEWGHFDPQVDKTALIEDVELLRQQAHQRFPKLPCVLLGHSMGSFIVRAYAQKYSQEIDGLIICGTGFESPVVLAAVQRLVRVMSAVKGAQYRSRLLLDKTLSSYARAFPAEGKRAWLTKDVGVQRRYARDPRCNFMFTIGGYQTLFSIYQDACSRRKINQMRRDLPILIISGEQDPVGAYGKGPRALQHALDANGFSHVTCTLYEGDRHEILNETDAQTVIADVAAFIKHACGYDKLQADL